MASVKIDGIEYQVEDGANMLETCLNLGLDLPYFCWHPALGSVGACRQCALVQYQREEDAHGRVVMGCMTPATDGAVFSLNGDQACNFRQAIVESLMLNHPHDCPVCAEGGECHLQDMTVMVGHRDRHYRGRKNTHRNQYLGPLIHHEMNRCISCYRCTRYYQDYAGGTDLAAMAARDHIYFGRHQEGLLESEFAGNLVEVCPTGVFTDKALVHEYTRKWDLQSAPSVCVGCGVGCNTLPGERYGRLKRIHNRFNREVNGYFLCDRGRFGGGFVNAEQRLDYPARRLADGSFRAEDSDVALQAISSRLGNGNVAAIGSPRAGLEANFLLRELVGADNFCTGIADAEHAKAQRILARLLASPAHNPSLAEIESADAILILGEDVTHSAPRLALALRQSVRNEAHRLAAKMRLQPWQDAAIRNLAQDRLSPLHIVAGYRTGLADVARSNSELTPEGQGQLADDCLTALQNPGGDSLAAQIAADLTAAQRPLIICGTSASEVLIDRAAALAQALCRQDRAAMLSYCLPECNSMGVTLLGQADGPTLNSLAERARRGEIETLLVLENDLFRRAGDTRVREMMDHIDCCIGLDCLENRTLELCDWVLPSAAFTETECTLVSSEGRAQRSFPVYLPTAQRRPAWRWLAALGGESPSFDEVCQRCADSQPLLAGVGACAPDHSFRNRGLKIPRQPPRYSGRTAMLADVSVHEPKQSEDPESPLAYSMEGSSGEGSAAVLPWVWSPGWNSNQSLHKFQEEVGGELRAGSDGVRLLDAATPPPSPIPSAATGEVELPAGHSLLIPRYRAFGSDELSMRVERIREVAGPACIYLNGEDAAALGVEEGDGVSLAGISLEMVLDQSLPPGCAAYSAGHPDSLGLLDQVSASLRRDGEWQRRQPRLIGTDAAGAGDV